MKRKIKLIWLQVINGFWSFMIILIFYFSISETTVRTPTWINLLPTSAEFLFIEMRDLLLARESSSSEHTTHTVGQIVELMKEVKSSSSYGEPIGDEFF